MNQVAIKDDMIDKDWWDEISDIEKLEIEEGLKEADRGEFISHDEVISKYQQWRLK